MHTLRFPTAEDYIRQLHPEYAFVLKVEQNAASHWGYGRADAKVAQSDMIDIVCAHARRRDAERSLNIVIEDQTVSNQSEIADSATH